MAEIKKSRNSNIELLRIIGMLLIIAYHARGGLFASFCDSNALAIVSNAIGIWGILGVDIFLIISCWYMIDRPLKSIRMLDILFQTFTYIIIFLIAKFIVLIYQGVSLPSIIKEYVMWFAEGFVDPLWSSEYWFITAYLFLMLVSPFLNQVLRSLTDEKLKRLLIVCSFVPVCLSLGATTVICDLAFFAYAYLFIGYLKRKKNIFEKLSWLGFIIGIATIFLFYSLNAFTDDSTMVGLAFHFIKYFIGDSGRYSILMFLSVLCLFYAVKNMKPRGNRIVNAVSRHTLGVYLFHDCQLFKIVEIVFDFAIIYGVLNKNILMFPLTYILLVVAIFILGIIFEALRNLLLQRPFLKFVNKHFGDKLNKIDGWFNS